MTTTFPSILVLLLLIIITPACQHAFKNDTHALVGISEQDVRCQRCCWSHPDDLSRLWLAVDHGHRGGIVALPRDVLRRERLVERLHLRRVELHLCSGDVLLQVLDALGARN